MILSISTRTISYYLTSYPTIRTCLPQVMLFWLRIRTHAGIQPTPYTNANPVKSFHILGWWLDVLVGMIGSVHPCWNHLKPINWQSHRPCICPLSTEKPTQSLAEVICKVTAVPATEGLIGKEAATKRSWEIAALLPCCYIQLRIKSAIILFLRSLFQVQWKHAKTAATPTSYHGFGRVQATGWQQHPRAQGVLS